MSTESQIFVIFIHIFSNFHPFPTPNTCLKYFLKWPKLSFRKFSYSIFEFFVVFGIIPDQIWPRCSCKIFLIKKILFYRLKELRSQNNSRWGNRGKIIGYINSDVGSNIVRNNKEIHPLSIIFLRRKFQNVLKNRVIKLFIAASRIHRHMFAGQFFHFVLTFVFFFLDLKTFRFIAA